MAEDTDTADMQKILFSNLLIMLSTSAMQQLGKLVDPSIGNAEVNLEGAQVSIDMLEMLQARTKGNLDTDEERMLKDLLASLQMNYVETAREQGNKGSATAGEEPAGEADEAEAPPEAPEVEPAGGGEKEAKFHKSYGG
jgi:hypothetical protein